MNLIRNEKHLKRFLLFALSLSMVLSCACIEETKNGSDNKNTPAAADGLLDEKEASTKEATKASQANTSKEVKNESTTTVWEEPVTEETAEETEAVTEQEESTTQPETTTEAPETTTEVPETTPGPGPVPDTPAETPAEIPAETPAETPADTEPAETPADTEPQETPGEREPEIVVVPAVVDPVEETEAEQETKGTRPPVVDETPDCDYVANMNSYKFHYPWCSSVDQMAEHNKWYFFGTREELIEAGYEPCKRCKP